MKIHDITIINMAHLPTRDWHVVFSELVMKAWMLTFAAPDSPGSVWVEIDEY